METKQTLKEVMALWKEAVASFNTGENEKCLELYSKVEAKSGRIYYNMGCVYNKLNQRTEALQCFTKAVMRDPHLAIAFFQRGVILLECRRLDDAMSDFVAVRFLLRGNTYIYYKQLGLQYKLHLCEILYNMALICIFKGDGNEAEKLISQCMHETEYKHRKQVLIAQEYIQVPPDVTFTPPKDVVDNLEKKNVMGKAKVVSASDLNDLDPAFNGPKRVEELQQAGKQSPCKTVLRNAKRFVKNPGAKRDRRKSEGVFIGQSNLNFSQSMSDLRPMSESDIILSQTLQSAGKSTLFEKKSNSVLNLNMHKSASAQQLKWSFGEKSATTKKSPNIQKETQKPVLKLDIPKSAPAQQLKWSFGKKSPNTSRKVSLGSIFGSKGSPVNTLLSESFDMLSAVVAPVTDNNFGKGFSPISLNHEHFRTSSDDGSEIMDDDVTDVFIDNNRLGESLSEKHERGVHETNTQEKKSRTSIFNFSNTCSLNSSGLSNEKKSQENPSNTFCADIPGSGDDGGDVKRSCERDENESDITDLTKSVSGIDLRSPRTRKIPPPPSYPPPPLPPNIAVKVTGDH